MFSEAKIALMREVKLHHPDLVTQLVEQESKEWADQLGTIAAYLFIIMDGVYLPAQLEDLTEKLVWKLRAKRKQIASPRIGIALKDLDKKPPPPPEILH